MLHSRYEEARPIPGTQTFHTFIPGTSNELIIKKFSTDTALGTQSSEEALKRRH
jgi:hypothetical protein